MVVYGIPLELLGVAAVLFAVLYALIRKNKRGRWLVLASFLPLCFYTYQAASYSPLWENGETLTVYYMDGTPDLRRKVSGIYPEWSWHANVYFDETDEWSEADIRVSFEGDKSWSALGNHANEVSGLRPTMSLAISEDDEDGWIRMTVMHEFGHAIGLAHECPRSIVPRWAMSHYLLVIESTDYCMNDNGGLMNSDKIVASLFYPRETSRGEER